MALKPALDAGNDLTLDYRNILQKQYKKKELYSMLDHNLQDVPKSLWVVSKETFNFSFVRKEREKDGSAPCSHLPPHVKEDWWTAILWSIRHLRIRMRNTISYSKVLLSTRMKRALVYFLRVESESMHIEGKAPWILLFTVQSQVVHNN